MDTALMTLVYVCSIAILACAVFAIGLSIVVTRRIARDRREFDERRERIREEIDRGARRTGGRL